jgi:hypothetical protein
MKMSERTLADTCIVLAAVCLAMLLLVSFSASHKADSRPIYQSACSIA